jgi:hypothetical protein
MNTITTPGTISPKVYVPVAVILAIGLILVLLGVVVDEQELKTLGYGVLGTSLPAAIAGFLAKPGSTVETLDPARMPDDGGTGVNELDDSDEVRPAPAVPPGEAGFTDTATLFLILALAGIVIAIFGPFWLGIGLLIAAVLIVIVLESRGRRRI